ncbi:MAG: DUF3021 domain-containing protein [Butyrivibrio sp.]|nr:DUF3021 domain-containing protein [Butyrivibrio sp.]
MKKIKVIMQQTMLVSFLVLCVVSLYGLFIMRTNEWCFDWYTPGSIVVASFCCSVVTVLLLYGDLYDKAPSVFRINVLTLIHFVLMYVIIMAFGKLFHWYNKAQGFILISVIFVVVYAGAWIGTGIMFWHDEKIISDALDNVRDEE